MRAGTLATAAAAAGIFIKMGEELCGAEAVREDEQNYKKNEMHNGDLPFL